MHMTVTQRATGSESSSTTRSRRRKMKLIGFSTNDGAYIVEITQEEMAKVGISKDKILTLLERNGKSTAFLKKSEKEKIES